MIRARMGILACLLVVAGCTTGTEDVTFNNPYDPTNAGGFPVPDSVGVTLGSNFVRLVWSIEPGSDVTEYAIFRHREDIDPPEQERLVATVSSRSFEDRQVRDGHVYLYRIAAGKSGQFGTKSEGIEARPAFFAIALASGAPRTRVPSVTVTLTGPATLEAIQLGESPDLSAATWIPVSTSLSWVLSSGEGSKTVYARFRLTDGSLSVPVSDDIQLDTRAVIHAVDFDGADVRAPGESLHLRLDAGESGGTASVTIGTLFSNVSLFDDGSAGDPLAGDGVYERDVVIPSSGLVNQASVIGSFTDLAGNAAASLTGPRTLTVGLPPQPVDLVSFETTQPPDAPAVTVRWTQSVDTGFRSYRLYRSDDATVDAGDHLAGEVTTAATIEFKDTDVIESHVYYYRVFVRNTLGLETGSGTLTVTVPNLRPPQAVVLDTPDGASDSRLSLHWSKTASEDFAAYRVYRNLTGAVSEQDPVITEIHDPDQTFFDDTGLVENTVYYYRVVVVDQAGLTARSNEVQGRTANLPPPAVVLGPGFDLDFTAATLSWTASDAHDFAAYRLYRDVVATVTTGSTLVAELKDKEAISFRDTGLASGHTYYYRVYVVDDGVVPGPKQSGSNVIEVDTP